MTDSQRAVYADVEQPLHVWVNEGPETGPGWRRHRWVLRDARHYLGAHGRQMGDGETKSAKSGRRKPRQMG